MDSLNQTVLSLKQKVESPGIPSSQPRQQIKATNLQRPSTNLNNTNSNSAAKTHRASNASTLKVGFTS